MSTQKRQSISIELKKKIIDEQEAHPQKSYADLAQQFTTDKIKLTSNNIKTIFGSKDKILEAIGERVGAKRKRLKTAKKPDLEAAVLTWFQQVRSQNVAVSGPLLKKKREYWEENGLDPLLFAALDKMEDERLKDQVAKMKQPTLHDSFTPQ